MTYRDDDRNANVRRAARIAAPLFYRTNAKDHPNVREGIILVRDGAPEWVTEVCHAAHQDGSDSIGLGMLPDDYRYQFISEALDAIAESDDDADLNELGDDYADNVDIYTGELTAWLGSRVDRYGYCDEWASEFGYIGEDGGKASPEVLALIRGGQYMERREVFGLVVDALADVELDPLPEETYAHDGQGNVTRHATTDGEHTLCGQAISPCEDRDDGRCYGYHAITDRTDVTQCAVCFPDVTP